VKFDSHHLELEDEEGALWPAIERLDFDLFAQCVTKTEAGNQEQADSDNASHGFCNSMVENRSAGWCRVSACVPTILGQFKQENYRLGRFNSR
jgi:hypothetical protein